MSHIDNGAVFAVVGAPNVRRHADARHQSWHGRHLSYSAIVAERRSLTDQPVHCSTTLQRGNTETSNGLE